MAFNPSNNINTGTLGNLAVAYLRRAMPNLEILSSASNPDYYRFKCQECGASMGVTKQLIEKLNDVTQLVKEYARVHIASCSQSPQYAAHQQQMQQAAMQQQATAAGLQGLQGLQSVAGLNSGMLGNTLSGTYTVSGTTTISNYYPASINVTSSFSDIDQLRQQYRRDFEALAYTIHELRQEMARMSKELTRIRGEQTRGISNPADEILDRMLQVIA